jgi:cell division protein FtsL
MTTIKFNDQGIKILETHQRLDEQPKVIKDMTNSKRILEQIKKHGPITKFDNKNVNPSNKIVSNMNSRLLDIRDKESRNS